jgi:hypothetical protein
VQALFKFLAIFDTKKKTAEISGPSLGRKRQGGVNEENDLRSGLNYGEK